MVRRYLVSEVLDDLAPTVRWFLRRTSALGVLSAELCDALLDSDDSAMILDSLQQRGLFIHVDRSGERYRYHQVLADHLELELTDALGPRSTRQWYRRAAGVLLAADEVRAAFRALARAGDWHGVEQLLSERGEEVIMGDAPAADTLPAELNRHDPWLRLAEARRRRDNGDLLGATAAYSSAADVAEDPDLVSRVRTEARSVGVWLPGAEMSLHDAYGVVRAATIRQPWQHLSVLNGRSDPRSVLASGVISGLCGDVERADRMFRMVAEHPLATADVVALATCARAGWRLIAGTQALPESHLVGIDQESEPSMPWLTRLARALIAAGRRDVATLSMIRISADLAGDQWGVALVSMMQALVTDHPQDYRETVVACERLGAPLVRVWAQSLGPLSVDSNRRTTAELAHEARTLGARDVPAIASGWRRSACSTGRRGQGQQRRSGRVEDISERSLFRAGEFQMLEPAVVRLTLFGGFEVSIRGAAVDMAAVRPRSRAAMHLLALNAGRWVHRDEIAAAMWPDSGSEAALRGLQVAMSSLRTELAKVSGGAPSLPARLGEGYGLVVSDGLASDLMDFEAAVTAARLARVEGWNDTERSELERALQLYTGDLLPEDGPAEWLVAERDRLRLVAADAAQALAVSHAAERDLGAGIDAARRCLQLDPYRDAGWKLLVRLHEQAGDPAAAQAALRRHQQVLAELGLPVVGSLSRP